MTLDGQRFFLKLAAAFCRGRLELDIETPVKQAIDAGMAAGLKLHKFKRNAELPRVRRVLGILRSFAPSSLLDIGSGRGVFLFPTLDELTLLPLTAIDIDRLRAKDLSAMNRGGIDRLQALQADVTSLPFSGHSYDVVTMLEVLEHLLSPLDAVTESLRVARDSVVVSVPSKADDNPQHIQVFDRQSLELLFKQAGAQRVSVDAVRGHLIAVAKVGRHDDIG